MPVFYEFRFTATGEVRKFFGCRGNYYRLANGISLEVDTVPVWCWKCQSFSHGESVPDIQYFDDYLAELADPTSQSYRVCDALKLKGTTTIANIADEEIRTKERRAWRLHRKSPAKCILCGSEDIRFFDKTGKDSRMKNPIAAGEIHLRWVGMCSTHFNEWFFTSEGHRIPLQTKPKKYKISGSIGTELFDIHDDYIRGEF